MPLTKRSISPVAVSLNRLPPNVRNNELECVANGTLANLVRQLSSLSRHAEDMFGELYRDAVKLEHKTNTLINRVDRLAMKVTQLDSNVEEEFRENTRGDIKILSDPDFFNRTWDGGIQHQKVKPKVPPRRPSMEVSLQDLHLRKPFKSSTLIDQQSLSRQTLPTAMSECYSRCDRPPELNKLNPFREDGKPGLKSYTDPEYFFRLWKEQMLNDGEQAKKTRHAPKAKAGGAEPGPSKKKEKRVKQPQDHRQKIIDNAVRAGNLPPEYQAPEMLRQQAMSRYTNPQQQPPTGMVRPESLDGIQPNGHYGGMDSMDSSASHPRVSVMGGQYPQHPQHQQNYAYQNQQVQQPGYHQQNRPVTSQYMPAGHLVNSSSHSYGPNYPVSDLDTPTASEGGLGGASSPAASMDSGRSGRAIGIRPNQAPPAPPPPPPWGEQGTVGGYPQQTRGPEQLNGELAQRMSRMNVNPDPSSSYPQPVPANQGGSNMNNNNSARKLPTVEENGRAPSPDLPPPPPPLSPHQLAHMSTSIVSNNTEKLPSPPPTGGIPPPPDAAAVTSAVPISTRSNIPPPPPPPPPMLNGNNKGGFTPAKTPAVTSPSGANKSAPARAPPVDARSDLLHAIRTGINLKKVDRQQEKQREKEAQEGHDVAAILRKRMEDVMGTSDSDDSRSEFGDEDEWDE